MNKTFSKTVIFGGSTALIAGQIFLVHFNELGEIVATPQPTPHVLHTHTDVTTGSLIDLPATQITSGAAVQVPVGTLNLQGFAPTVSVTSR